MVTPSLNKSFKFQSDWPYNNSQVYLINSIKPFEGMEVKVLELSPDKRFCYVWSNRDKIAVLKDINTSTGFEVKENNPDEHEETLMDKIVSE